MSLSPCTSLLMPRYSVTHTYFENLVRALENGLCDVEQPGKAAMQQAGLAAQQPQQQVQSGGKRDKKGQSGSSSNPVSSSSSAQAGGTARGSTSSTARGSTSMTVARLAKAAVRGRPGGHAAAAASTGLSAVASPSAPVGAGQGVVTLGLGSNVPASRSSSGAPHSTSTRSHQGDSIVGQQTAGTAPHRQPDYWSCAHCSFANRQSTNVCAMCNLPKGVP